MAVVHATEAELAGHLAGSDFTVPTGAAAQRLLKRASELVDDRVLAPYLTDAADVPTETHVADALRDATLAQVEQWLSVGEDNDVDGYPRDVSLGANGVSVGARPASLAPRARRALRRAGLLTAAGR